MSELTNDDIGNGYTHHRCASLIHRYFALLEDPSRPVDDFAELFADDIAFDFTMVQISSFDEFVSWATNFRNSFERFTLTVRGIDVDASAAPTFATSIDLDFAAIDTDGERRTMQTTHVWTIENDKIREIAVTHR